MVFWFFKKLKKIKEGLDEVTQNNLQIYRMLFDLLDFFLRNAVTYWNCFFKDFWEAQWDISKNFFENLRLFKYNFYIEIQLNIKFGFYRCLRTTVICMKESPWEWRLELSRYHLPKATNTFRPMRLARANTGNQGG